MRERCPLYPESGHVQRTSYVRFVPIADIPSIIRSPRRRARLACLDVEAKRFGGFEVDAEFDFGASLDRQLARLFAFENSSDVDTSQDDKRRVTLPP